MVEKETSKVRSVCVRNKAITCAHVLKISTDVESHSIVMAVTYKLLAIELQDMYLF